MTRPALAALLAFDMRLASLVTQAREPLLAQIRFAWWRERLREPGFARPIGEPLLEAIGKSWKGREDALVALVDGWEELLGESEPSAESCDPLVTARAGAFAACADISQASSEAVRTVGERWAFADLADRSPTIDAAAALRAAGRAIQPGGRLPRSMRGIAVLEALAARSLRREEPMLAGRSAALVALRVGMIGR